MKVVFDTNIIIDHLKGMPEAREQLMNVTLPKNRITKTASCGRDIFSMGRPDLGL